MALIDIQAYRGCETVADVGIRSIAVDRAECNWSIFVLNLGDADGVLAHRAAIPIEVRSDVGTTFATGQANEPRLKIG